LASLILASHSITQTSLSLRSLIAKIGVSDGLCRFANVLSTVRWLFNKNQTSNKFIYISKFQLHWSNNIVKVFYLLQFCFIFNKGIMQQKVIKIKKL
jgi:hypothetical protein